MTRSLARRVGPGLIAVFALGFFAPLARSQPNIAMPPGIAQSGMLSPQYPIPGNWAEVLTVTDNWLVLVNEAGQQFPVSRSAINLFVIRWPTTPERIAPESLIEVSGIDLSTNSVQADHVDVFYGASINLVNPVAERVMGQGRALTPFDIWNQTRTGFNYLWMMSPHEAILPMGLHIVGPPVSTIPLQIGINGNSFITIVPAPNGLSMSQVTLGTFSVLRPGDLAYFVNRRGQETPRTLNLSQLVIYKKMPLDQFR